MNTSSLDDDIYHEDDEEDYELEGIAKSEIPQRGAFLDALNQVSSSLLVLSGFWNSGFAFLLEELLVPFRPRLAAICAVYLYLRVAHTMK